MDKRSESQFAAVGTNVIAPAKTGPGGSWVEKTGTSRVETGTPQDLMKSVASLGRLFQGHNEAPTMRDPEIPRWKVETAVSGDISRPGIDVATKEGRKAVADKLGLPNKKEFRAKKGNK
jgi:hypothetical protein